MTFFLAPLAVPAIGAGLSMATGAIARGLDDDKDVLDYSSIGTDAGLGAALSFLPGVGSSVAKAGLSRLGASSALSRAPWASSGVTGLAGRLPQTKWLGLHAPNMGLIGKGAQGFIPASHAWKENQSNPGPPPASREQGAGMNVFGPPAPDGYFSRAALREFEDNYGLSDDDLFGASIPPQPTFSGSFMNYMKDPVLRGVANAEIINQNAAIMREQKDLKRHRNRAIDSAGRSGKNVRQQISGIADERADQHADAMAHLDDRQDENRIDVERMIRRMSAGSSDDLTRAEINRRGAKDARQVARGERADRQLLGDIGTAGEDQLALLEAAESQQTRAEQREIKNSYEDKILQNRQQAADNWFARPTLLGQLANQAMSQDLQKHYYDTIAWQTAANAASSQRNTDANLRLQRAQLLAQAQQGPDIQDQIAMWKFWNEPAGPQVTVDVNGGTAKVGKVAGDYYYDAFGQSPYPTFTPTPQEQIDWINKVMED